MIKIGVDLLGFENNPLEAYKACVEFKKVFKDVEFLLVGDKNKIPLENEFEFIHTEEFISQEDNILTLRKKKNTSIQILTDLLNEDKVDGILSACNTGVFIFHLYSKIGLISGIQKIGLMPTIPKTNGIFNMVDVGASLDVSPIDLLNFAIVANEYAKQNTENPIIKLLNIGTEDHKGHQLQIDTNKLLKENKNLNYHGFIESKELLSSNADLVVADAFSGNIALKALEGTASTMAKLLKKEFKKPKNILFGLICKPIFKKIFKKFDYKENAGAVLIGLNKNAVKTHGSADFKQFYSSLRYLREIIINDTLNKVKKAIEENNLISKGE